MVVMVVRPCGGKGLRGRGRSGRAGPGFRNALDRMVEVAEESVGTRSAEPKRTR